jgi:transcriptional regulator with XRE-family HTH domain
MIHAAGCLAVEFYRTTPALALAEAIRTARESCGIKQKDLAALVHVHPKTVSLWEFGRKIPHPRNMNTLSDVLGISGY